MDSDSSSDDEFATAGSITRRKLLESFYGQSKGGTEDSSALNDGTDSPTRNASGATSRVGEENGNTQPEARGSSADAKDLDSQYFDVASHTAHHVVNSSVEKLLEMDEQLTLQVRTLDSTTQNMVYENYSKFIDATDAVKSVGVNVQANEQGLQRLKKGMETINEQSRVVDDDLGSLRDAVAEKIRVKRLLTRLDALLKLPETLKELIAQGKYMTAASSFCRSTNILSKQSAGFESLQKIEAECNEILAKMIKDLNKKILHWSGHENTLGLASSASDEEDNIPDTSEGKTDEDDASSDPPASISEIFECAGTLAMLIRENVYLRWDASVSVEDCMTMSLAATVRFLDRLFDTHQLEIQELSLNASISPNVDDGAAFEGDHSGRSQQTHRGQHLVPTVVADSILEAATLFRVSFHDNSQQNSESEPDPLEEFVKEAYSSFLSHVRSILIEYSLGVHSGQDENSDDHDGDELYEDVAGAMSILIQAVRELASGLSLPEVGISGNVCASFCEQASDLTETLVRRRVDKKFCDLRLRVLSHCLVPFATRIVGSEEEEEKGDGDLPGDERTRMLQVVQIAVSDCLQLLDDTVRSIVSGRDVMGASVGSVDLPMLKQSIQASTGRFASWLAGTLEVLTGCESSDGNFAFEASEATKGVDAGLAAEDPRAAVTTGQDDISEMSDQYDALAEKIDDALQDLIQQLGAKNQELGFALKMVEMCRGCERAFVDNMIQSIDSNVGGGKKGRSSANGLFDDKKSSVVLSEHERKTTGRFRLAASRILILYATNQGFDAAGTLCPVLCAYAETEDDNFPRGASVAACRVLEIAKQASQDCGTLFGAKKRASPLPRFTNIVPASQPLAMSSSPLKGLQLDVERMFQEKVSIYPHTTYTLDFSLDGILLVFFKVVFKAIAEQTRLCSFTSDGYNQLLVDVEFLREMVSHYMDKDYQVEGANACSSLSSLLTEVLNFAGERCEADVIGNDDLTHRAYSSLSEFIKTDPNSFKFVMES